MKKRYRRVIPPLSELLRPSLRRRRKISRPVRATDKTMASGMAFVA